MGNLASAGPFKLGQTVFDWSGRPGEIVGIHRSGEGIVMFGVRHERTGKPSFKVDWYRSTQLLIDQPRAES